MQSRLCHRLVETFIKRFPRSSVSFKFDLHKWLKLIGVMIYDLFDKRIYFNCLVH